LQKIVLAVGIFLFLFAFNVKAANVGDIVNFNVDKGFDISSRTQAPASLVKITDKLYFYIEKPWWDAQRFSNRRQFWQIWIICLVNLIIIFIQNLPLFLEQNGVLA